MAQMRCTAKARVRSEVMTRTGVKDGKEWTIREVEVMDDDDNKVTLSLRKGVGAELKVGQHYDIVLDVETEYRLNARADVVSITPAAAPAGAGNR